MAEKPQNDTPAPLRAYACVLCHKRKIKCDRNEPCSNCVKIRTPCDYRQPLPPRRRRKPETVLLQRIKRYEEVLRKNGINPDEIDGIGGRDQSFLHEDQTPYPLGSTTPAGSQGPLSARGELISKDGRSIYLDNHLWKSVSNELCDNEKFLTESPEDDADDTTDDVEIDNYNSNFLVFGSASRSSLVHLHPSSLEIFNLWQVFLERVNPLTKIMHSPTVQIQILDAAKRPDSVSKELEALMFAIYYSSLVSLSSSEVQEMFNESREILMKRYRRGIQQALVNAGILKTSSIIVLQAFMIFITSARLAYDTHTLWSLSSIAVRIAQRLGIHRDGSELGLSVFESEMRRRLWWQIDMIDSSVGHMSGSFSGVFPLSQTNLPLNVNDSDLYPDMKDNPLEHRGSTEMLFCLSRYVTRACISKHPQLRELMLKSPWPIMREWAPKLEDKDCFIDAGEILRERFLRHCDESIPFHLLALTTGKIIQAMMNLFAQHPYTNQLSDKSITQSENNRFFSVCLEVAECECILLTDEKTRRYLWYISFHVPWDTLVFLLFELRTRVSGDEVSKAWNCIDIICSVTFEQIGPNALNHLSFAIARLTLKIWQMHTRECARRGIATAARPRVIDLFSRMLGNNKINEPENASEAREAVSEGYSDDLSYKDYQKEGEVINQGILSADPSNMGSNMGVDLSDDNILDWEQWSSLMQQFPWPFNEMER